MGDELLKVFVTSIIDPSMFWARIGCDVELEREPMLEDIISDCVSQVVQDRSQFQDIVLDQNQIILAKSTEHGGRWLRATAVSCSSSQLTSEIDVVFTGYGSNELVGWRDIITAVPDFVCEWRKSAECFCLDGVEPIDDGWSTEAVEYFSNCVLKKRLLCERVDGDRLVIYTSKGERETIQDCLVRKRFAKRSPDEGILVTHPSMMNGHTSSIAAVAAAAAATGGIPEFDTMGLFSRSDSPTLPSQDTLSPPRDFELELHKRFLDTSEGGLPTHSDDVYCGRRSANNSHLGSEQYITKARDIKDELAQISKVNRQLVRSEGRPPGSSRLRSNRSSTDPRNGFKTLKMLEKDEDDWRVPKVSRSLGSPNDEVSKRATNEQEYFKEDLQNLRMHLNRNSSHEVIVAFLRQILQKDDLRHRKLLSCLTVIVDEMMDNDEMLMTRYLDLLEALQSEKEFHECLVDVIAQIHVACIQIADFEFLKLRMMLFTELLAHLILRFPEESLIVEHALEIVDFWISSKIKSSDVQSVQKIYASCLKNFVCIVALHSVHLVRQSLFHLLNAVREMLISDVQPRSVREIWLDLLLYIEQKETENRMMSSKTFGQIGDQSQTRHNGSMDCTDISSIVSPENTSLHSNVAAAASPALSSTSHSSFRSAGAASLNENHVTPPASRSSPFIAGAASLSEGSPESLSKLSNRNRSESSESRPSMQKPSKKKAQKKMSLQSFYATTSSPVAFERTPDRAIFRDDVNCVTCGSQYHMTSDCPDRGSKFIL